MTAHSSPVQARRHPFGKLEGEEMRNPRVSAAVSIAGIVIVGSMMLFSTEAPSGALTVLQWLPWPGLGASGRMHDPGQHPPSGDDVLEVDAESAGYFASAATPGSVLPSIHSRKAPPAVET
jgi:hypothetical protein